jgi:hypothetical protein
MADFTKSKPTPEDTDSTGDCGLGGYVSVNYCFRSKVRCHKVVVYFQEPTKIRESKSPNLAAKRRGQVGAPGAYPGTPDILSNLLQGRARRTYGKGELGRG